MHSDYGSKISNDDDIPDISSFDYTNVAPLPSNVNGMGQIPLIGIHQFDQKESMNMSNGMQQQMTQGNQGFVNNHIRSHHPVYQYVTDRYGNYIPQPIQYPIQYPNRMEMQSSRLKPNYKPEYPIYEEEYSGSFEDNSLQKNKKMAQLQSQVKEYQSRVLDNLTGESKKSRSRTQLKFKDKNENKSSSEENLKLKIDRKKLLSIYKNKFNEKMKKNSVKLKSKKNEAVFRTNNSSDIQSYLDSKSFDSSLTKLASLDVIKRSYSQKSRSLSNAKLNTSNKVTKENILEDIDNSNITIYTNKGINITSDSNIHSSELPILTIDESIVNQPKATPENDKNSNLLFYSIIKRISNFIGFKRFNYFAKESKKSALQSNENHKIHMDQSTCSDKKLVFAINYDTSSYMGKSIDIITKKLPELTTDANIFQNDKRENRLFNFILNAIIILTIIAIVYILYSS